jgi:ADP-ribose pyrophosphatase YjhB (NUDIX family)
MALPGGKREPKDKDLKDTVMRETMEETGIKLDDRHFLGVLTAISSEPKPEIKILPFIVLLEDEPKLKLNKEELESFIWVPFEEIVQSKGTVEFSFGKVPGYIFADAIVWGVTYRIISKLIQAVEKASNK